MDLQKLLGFALDPVRIDPDGSSTPPEVSPLAPPTKPGLKAPDQQRLLEATRIQGLEAPPRPPEVPARAAAAAAAALPAPGHLAALAARLRSAVRGGARPPQRWALIAVSSTLIGFGATVLVALLLRAREPTPERADSNAARARDTPGAGAATAAPLGDAQVLLEACARQREAELVTSGVSSSFALEARALEGGVEVLLGLSAGGGTALGLKLNATTLAASELLRDTGSRELLGVVPLPNATPPGFMIDRASVGGFREWRTLPDRPAWALTRTNRALNLTERATRRSQVLWPLGAGEEISRPRLEWQDAEHLALVLRQGGRRGRLLIGWLNPERSEHSALRELPFAGSELGLPSLATKGTIAAVAAAARDSGSAPWHVELVSSEWQGRTRRIEVPAVGAGSERESFAPSLAALRDSRWFLQWTEGQQGLRQVRGVTLDNEFGVLGAAIVLSPPGASAGGGSVLAVDEGLLSLFLVQRGSSYELWATTLSCR